MSRQIRWFGIAVGVVAVVLLWLALVRRNAGERMPVRDFVSPAAAQNTPPAQPTAYQETVVFAEPAGELLQMEIAVPTHTQGLRPAVVCMHGGGWVSGDRKQMTNTIDVLARRGYVAVAPDYRLATKYPFPACIEDARVAVRWLRANAGKYRINPDRVGVTGLSAGAHLACLLAVTDPCEVQAAVCMATPVDLRDEAIWTKETLTRNLIPLLGGHPRKQLDECRNASPISYSPRTKVPMLLIHGGDDKVIPVRQVQAFAQKMNGEGGWVKVLELEGQGHAFQGFALRRAIDSMLSFLDENLKK